MGNCFKGISEIFNKRNQTSLGKNRKNLGRRDSESQDFEEISKGPPQSILLNKVELKDSATETDDKLFSLAENLVNMNTNSYNEKIPPILRYRDSMDIIMDRLRNSEIESPTISSYEIKDNDVSLLNLQFLI
ncbi:uncharacterized protein LOC111628878 [Centruroides sculpturatus]|uniref:uncharacterized protein LOC111628859 n=1 Tax=Centruroides sculpturatus TaxID=218467 RepID=UPI000C6E8CB5|nr:uncharacterized protein LOC111628859 [Centruroides sculpturatus]XP_023228504.1 uncharacterized protein LOC111628878 [Centruroides sculpturatus]